MKNIMAITVASWLAVATAAGQTSQQSMPGMDMSQHDISSMQNAPTNANQQLQEPENPAMQTGALLPAPELLQEVNVRPPKKLGEFIQFADANNPTLKQAAAIVRRSAAQASQSG